MPLQVVSPSPRRKRGASSQAVAPAPTREVILDTAERLFALHGVHGVAVRDLAREMNLTAPSLYNHFPSKLALYDAVLERGLMPIVQLIGEAWQAGAQNPDRIHDTVDSMVAHLAHHPHLARLMQRLLMSESDRAKQWIERRMEPLYREGFQVLSATADGAGWDPEELPHLALGLFGLVFAYFTNTAALRTIAPGLDPLSDRALALQRDFLEKAIYRLIGPQKRANERRKTS